MRTDYDTLVDDIAARADIDNLATAERAAIDTLRTLGEYLSAGDADALGMVLPGALGDAVTEFRATQPDAHSSEAFVEQIADRQGIGVEPADAVLHSRAVVAAIAAHGGRDELQRAQAGLPEEFAPLFETANLAG